MFPKIMPASTDSRAQPQAKRMAEISSFLAVCFRCRLIPAASSPRLSARRRANRSLTQEKRKPRVHSPAINGTPTPMIIRNVSKSSSTICSLFRCFQIACGQAAAGRGTRPLRADVGSGGRIVPPPEGLCCRYHPSTALEGGPPPLQAGEVCLIPDPWIKSSAGTAGPGRPRRSRGRPWRC